MKSPYLLIREEMRGFRHPGRSAAEKRVIEQATAVYRAAHRRPLFWTHTVNLPRLSAGNGSVEPITEYTNIRPEVVGEGFEDQDGRPTVDGKWYRLADDEETGEFGIIVGGPYGSIEDADKARAVAR